MKIQYFHRRNYNNKNKLIARGGVTIALDLDGLNWKTFTDLTCGQTITIPAAVALCSADDMYSKPIGRKLCNERISPRTFNYVDIQFVPNSDNQRVMVTLENGGISFILILSEHSVRFVYCE
jgi:hypothetical protein